MSIKRMSLRFNLDNKADRSAWEYLKKTRRLLLPSISFTNRTQKLQRLLRKPFMNACGTFL